MNDKRKQNMIRFDKNKSSDNPTASKNDSSKNKFFGEGVKIKTNVSVKKSQKPTGTRSRRIDTNIKKFEKALESGNLPESRDPSMKNLETLAQIHSGERNRNNQRMSYLQGGRTSVIGSRVSLLGSGLSSKKNSKKHKQRSRRRMKSRIEGQQNPILD